MASSGDVRATFFQIFIFFWFCFSSSPLFSSNLLWTSSVQRTVQRFSHPLRCTFNLECNPSAFSLKYLDWKLWALLAQAIHLSVYKLYSLALLQRWRSASSVHTACTSGNASSSFLILGFFCSLKKRSLTRCISNAAKLKNENTTNQWSTVYG